MTQIINSSLLEAQSYDSKAIQQVKEFLRSGEVPETAADLHAMLLAVIEDRSNWIELFNVQYNALKGFNSECADNEAELTKVYSDAILAVQDSDDFLNHRGAYENEG